VKKNGLLGGEVTVPRTAIEEVETGRIDLNMTKERSRTSTDDRPGCATNPGSVVALGRAVVPGFGVTIGLRRAADEPRTGGCRLAASCQRMAGLEPGGDPAYRPPTRR
jgi:hypothetical protein